MHVWETSYDTQWKISLSEIQHDGKLNFHDLKPSSPNSYQSWFECGVQRNSYEVYKIPMPNTTWDPCIIQLQVWRGDKISYQCGTISLKNDPSLGWEGKCMNGGSCYNSRCLCLSGYGGEYCDGAHTFTGNKPSNPIIFIIILAILVFFIIFAWWVLRFVRKQRESIEEQVAEFKTKPIDFEDSIFDIDSTDNSEIQEPKRFQRASRNYSNN